MPSTFVINLDNGGIGAGIVLRTPCEVTIGSGAQVVNEAGSFKIEEFRAIALPDEPIFKQLEQLSNGDTVIINGGFITYGAGTHLSSVDQSSDSLNFDLFSRALSSSRVAISVSRLATISVRSLFSFLTLSNSFLALLKSP